MTRILIVDNYDSFVHNIAQSLGELGADVIVLRNDSPGLLSMDVDGYVISPGPGHPRDSRGSLDVIREAEEPLLGVCLGHQAIAHVHGGTIVKGAPVHGKVSDIDHAGDGILEGVPAPFTATRYHSLVVREDGLPDRIEVIARSEGTVMGLRVRGRETFGLQFHPESIMTRSGDRILENFLRRCA